MCYCDQIITVSFHCLHPADSVAVKERKNIRKNSMVFWCNVCCKWKFTIRRQHKPNSAISGTCSAVKGWKLIWQHAFYKMTCSYRTHILQDKCVFLDVLLVLWFSALMLWDWLSWVSHWVGLFVSKSCGLFYHLLDVFFSPIKVLFCVLFLWN